MKMCFKFHQNLTTNEEFDFWRVKGAGVSRFKKYERASYRTVVPTHTENFSILAQLELHNIIFLFWSNPYLEHPKILVHIHFLQVSMDQHVLMLHLSCDPVFLLTLNYLSRFILHVTHQTGKVSELDGFTLKAGRSTPVTRIMSYRYLLTSPCAHGS